MLKSKEDWILAAVDVLREQGINAVKVEALARRLGVTKGSFYGYFLNRDALLQEMLDHWEGVLTAQIINSVSNLSGDLYKKISKILEMVDDHMDANVEMSMMTWSFRDERARNVVNRIVRNRIDFMKGLFLDAGFSQEQSELRARLTHSFVHGDRCYPETCEAKNTEERGKIIRAFAKLICAPDDK